MGGQERRVANIGRVAREEEGGGGATRKMLTTFISHNLLVREALEGSMVCTFKNCVTNTYNRIE